MTLQETLTRFAKLGDGCMWGRLRILQDGKVYVRLWPATAESGIVDPAELCVTDNDATYLDTDVEIPT